MSFGMHVNNCSQISQCRAGGNSLPAAAWVSRVRGFNLLWHVSRGELKGLCLSSSISRSQSLELNLVGRTNFVDVVKESLVLDLSRKAQGSEMTYVRKNEIKVYQMSCSASSTTFCSGT